MNCETSAKLAGAEGVVALWPLWALLAVNQEMPIAIKQRLTITHWLWIIAKDMKIINEKENTIKWQTILVSALSVRLRREIESKFEPFF